jgi:uncharacterized membrane protein YqgA involved in biofilm formation
MLGTIVNAVAIIIGSLMGVLIKKGVPVKISDIVMKAVALCVLYIGISGALKGNNTLVLVVSMALGAVIGQLLDLDKWLHKLGDFLSKKLKSKDQNMSVGEGFVTASLLFCVGAMAIVGPLQSGLAGDNSTLYTKSILDGIASIIFASQFGIGVMLSAAAVFVYQGAIAVMATWIAPFLNDLAIAEMTCVGSVIIIALALNILGITKIKVMNLVPAIFLSPLVLYLFDFISKILA